jgi:hypothetical protein
MMSRIVSSILALPVCFIAACAAESDGDVLDSPDPAVSTAPAQHCVVSPSGEEGCYASFTEAIAVATGGAITDAPDDSRAAVDDPEFIARLDALGSARPKPTNGSAQLSSSVVVGIVWKDANFLGDSWIFWKPWGCDGNPATKDWEISNLNAPPYSDYGFNDVISSFRSYAWCTTVLYDDWMGFGASLSGEEMSYVGDTMNDRTSSIRFY